ncbi:MAG: LytTR family DNA-binding domain-containing protein, partial [Fulvivirga sp.]
LRSLGEKPATIFTTAYPDYALESYELDVVDYLVKPISFDRFLKAADKAHLRHQQGKIASQDAPSFILLKADHKTYKIYYDDISFIEGAREYVVFHTTSGKIMILKALKKLEEELPAQFVRIHKSYIVNKDKITAQHGMKTLQIGSKVFPVGKSYRQKILNIFTSC